MKIDLSELKKKLQVRSALGITIESGRIAVDYLREEEAGTQVVKSFVIPMGADNVMADSERVGKELAAHLEAAGIRERRCVICLPVNWAMTTTTEVPGVSGDDLRGYLELRAEREFPVSVSDLRLAHCAYVLPGGDQRATLAAIPSKRMDAVQRMLDAAQCRAVSISLGLDACIANSASPSALHFVANGNHVDLVVAAGGGIAALRSLPAPSTEGKTDFDARGFSREVRITLGRLPEAVRQEVKEARFSGTPGTARELCNEIRPHLIQLGIDSHLENTNANGAHPGAAVEATQHHLSHRPVVFEFLPPETNRWDEFLHRFDSPRNRRIAAAIVGTILLLIVTYFVRSHIESSLTAEWNGMRRTVSDLEVLQQDIRKYRPWFEPAPRALNVLEGVIATFPEQGDVWAKSVELGEDGKVTCTGFARSQSTLISLLERIRARPEVSAVQVQQVRGENPVQFTVAFKWEVRDAK